MGFPLPFGEGVGSVTRRTLENAAFAPQSLEHVIRKVKQLKRLAPSLLSCFPVDPGSHCFPQLSSWRPASRAFRQQTVVEWCCSAFAENATSGTSKALPHCVRPWLPFLRPLQPSISGKIRRGARQKPSVATRHVLDLYHPILYCP